MLNQVFNADNARVLAGFRRAAPSERPDAR